MKSSFFVGCLIILGVILYILAPSSVSFERMKESTVKVTVKDGHGSGVIVGTRLVLTAKHVVVDDDSPVILFDDSSSTQGHVVWLGVGDYDLALIRLDRDSTEPSAILSCTPPKLGDKVYAVGYPLSQPVSTTPGIVASTVVDKELLEITAPLIFGMSGGPTYNESGQIIGLNDAILTIDLGGIFPSISGINVIVPITAVCENQISF